MLTGKSCTVYHSVVLMKDKNRKLVGCTMDQLHVVDYEISIIHDWIENLILCV